jgi:hypothetical protein
MTPEDIQEFCIAGTDAYLQFLIANNRGVQATDVVRIEQVRDSESLCFNLILQARLFSAEAVSVRLSPPGREFGPEDFRVVEYDADAKCLLIETRNPEMDLEERLADEVKVVSDLRFLVRNVRDWFRDHGSEVALPQRGITNRESPSADLILPLEPCQQESISVSLASPLTYVWGPPGTGKTRHVLAAAVVGLLRSGKKIGIYAPTNNALEQAMEAVILAAEDCDVDRRKFLRVGHPSAKFAHKFPEVCEIQGLRGQIAELRRQGRNCITVLEHRRGATVLGSVAVLHHQIGELRTMLDRRREICGLLAGGLLRKVLSTLKGERQALETDLTEVERRIQGQLEMIRRTQTESDKLNKIVAGLNFTNIETTSAEVSHLEAKAVGYLARKAAIAHEYEEQSSEEIQRRIADLDSRIKQLESQELGERIQAASIIGMTLDCHIGRFSGQFIEFDHAFLDEAGYAPAIKALTLFRRGLPLTFIGDHKQLGPVCEMNDENLEMSDNKSALVWRKSALFVDDLFLSKSTPELVNDSLNLPEPRLRAFAKAQLTKTFRFGQNLADILAECVYDGTVFVSGACDAELRITCLNAVPAAPPAKKRENRAEAECIARYLQAHAEFQDRTENNWAILTPYRNQESLLGLVMPDARRDDRITNIHKSQGREWDTVFLSVVDSNEPPNTPWFTNTSNPQSGGLHVMNTAISRARKHLILACDCHFWQHRPDGARQLISRLLELAQGASQ